MYQPETRPIRGFSSEDERLIRAVPRLPAHRRVAIWFVSAATVVLSLTLILVCAWAAYLIGSHW